MAGLTRRTMRLFADLGEDLSSAASVKGFRLTVTARIEASSDLLALPVELSHLLSRVSTEINFDLAKRGF